MGMGCGHRDRAQDPENVILLELGGKTLSKAAFDRSIRDLSPEQQDRLRTSTKRLEYFHQYVEQQLLLKHAQETGAFDVPELHGIEHSLARRLWRMRLSTRFKPEDISEQAIAAYYKRRAVDFQQPEQVRASHIVWRSQRDAAKALVKLCRDPSMALFRTYARDAAGGATSGSSNDGTGDLGFFSLPGERGENPGIPPAVVKAAFALSTVGDYAARPIRSDQGYHVVRLTARRPGFSRPLSEVQHVIRQRLWRDKRDQKAAEAVAALRPQVGVVVHTDALRQWHACATGECIP